MSHPKYDVFKRCIDSLGGKPPPPGWVQNTIQLLLAAGATQEDLREISEQIKRGLNSTAKIA